MQSLLSGDPGELLITAVFQQTCDGIYLVFIESVTGLPTGRSKTLLQARLFGR